MNEAKRKATGSYYTPDQVVRTLVSWAVRKRSDRLLDPACGDGRFIAAHRNSVGIEHNLEAAKVAVERAPGALVHKGDLFTWASSTKEQFECAAGNPPFIRYQAFSGKMRERALALCATLGANFSGLASSWAPFLVATASRLLPGGRMAFVVPAEIGHAPYAAPLLEYLIANFKTVHVIAVREKLFPELSEDCWILYTDGFGASTSTIRFTALDRFSPGEQLPRSGLDITVTEWRDEWRRRLRPFLLQYQAREIYRDVYRRSETIRFGDVASIGIGYVTGANDFFHLRPSVAAEWNIHKQFLHPTVRNGRALQSSRITAATVERWTKADDPILLLRLSKEAHLPSTVMRYLNTDEGKDAREGYKCRNRDPWYSVPDVQIPDFFLTYMSGRSPNLVRNDAGCTCTNSVHSVRLKAGKSPAELARRWETSFTQLSCEIEGHPLGGGMLKLEPREACEVRLPDSNLDAELDGGIVEEALAVMRTWRHYAASTEQGAE